MNKLFGKADRGNNSLEHEPIVFDVSRLRDDERLEFKYDHNHQLIAVQKIKLSLFKEPIEGLAETDIPAGGSGRIFYQGTSWKARSEAEVPISAGQIVLVKARYELTLFVVPAYSL
ncbi:NfeD family protein [Aerosakkonemataceae cyanobacterium BLCC-F154]|uniref:NfeD family protein n=1 Tax=Floridaenema fluviatile BLCC-F154 TaxID=3153640 RepID=A0ABV4YHJ1_9CYAN